MTQEMDEKEFEDTYWNFIFDKSNANERYDAVKYFFMESRRLLRERFSKLQDQENLDPKIVEFVSKNFWDLI